ncbi:MAG: hypothetical protein ACXIUB_00970 [Wenzhouxiangella sp.]
MELTRRRENAELKENKTFWTPSSKAAKKNERKRLINGPGRAQVTPVVFNPFLLPCFPASRQKDFQKADHQECTGLGKTSWTPSSKAAKKNERKRLINGPGRAHVNPAVFNPFLLPCFPASRQKGFQERRPSASVFCMGCMP